jgi:cbb3-type cytochrome oxidase subunit 3
MAVQNLSNHRRYVPGFHILTATLCVVVFIASIFNLVHNWYDPDNHLSAAIIFFITIILCLFFWYIRSFALRAQDRAIRAEESLRHFLLTGKPVDPRLRLGQIIALRFASDEELAELTKRAVDESLRADDIKKAIRNWKEDKHRV